MAASLGLATVTSRAFGFGGASLPVLLQPVPPSKTKEQAPRDKKTRVFVQSIVHLVFKAVSIANREKEQDED
jgi:hypothetical protein